MLLVLRYFKRFEPLLLLIHLYVSINMLNLIALWLLFVCRVRFPFGVLLALWSLLGCQA